MDTYEVKRGATPKETGATSVAAESFLVPNFGEGAKADADATNRAATASFILI